MQSSVMQKNNADQTIKDFNKFGKANISIKEMENKRQDLRKKMNKVESNMSRKEKKVTGNLKPSDLHLGDGVKVLSLNLKGTVSTSRMPKVIFWYRWVSCDPRSISPIWYCYRKKL